MIGTTHTPEEIQRILADNRLHGETNGREGKRANLTDANLTGADLSRAYLRGAYLRGADLTDADLRDANLDGANLARTCLARTCLAGANLVGANLTDANLTGADLSRAYLRGAYLRGADLTDADLRDANLTDANLVGANLVGANLVGANLVGANLARTCLARTCLADADLRDANLARACLAGANLVGANLTDANLEGADLEGAGDFEPLICVGPIGRRQAYTTVYLYQDKVRCGCFTGTLAQFEAAVRRTHSGNPLHLTEYLGLIAYATALRTAQPQRPGREPELPAPFQEGDHVRLSTDGKATQVSALRIHREGDAMNRCPRCGGAVHRPNLSRGPFDSPYCSCPLAQTTTMDSTDGEARGAGSDNISVIEAAISYAALGVRDAARRMLAQITSPASMAGRLIDQEAELKELRDYAHWATYALRGIAGEKRIVSPTVEEEARIFLSHHARVANRVMPMPAPPGWRIET